MASAKPSSDRLWMAFAASSVLCLGVLAVSPVKDHFREYRRYQQQYQQRLLHSAGSSKELREAQGETVGVRQIWLPSLDDAVDRCPSCHLGVDKPKMAGAPEPYRLHPMTPHTPADTSRFGCVVCHRGQGRATSRAEAHGDVPDWSAPLLPLAYTEASCGACHTGDEVPEAALLSQGRALMRRAGCYACHRLAGNEDFESEAPDLDGLGQKTSADWLRAWLKEPRKMRPATLMPDFHLADSELEALVAYLWAQPAKVNVDLTLVTEPEPGDAEAGKKLFSRSRCISCHTVDGRGNGSAPELSGIGSEVNRKWLTTFLAEPHSFQPRTRMPRYHFTDQEVRDLSQYMMEEFSDPSAPAAGAPYHPPQKLVDEGQQLFARYACGACHRLGGKGDTARTGPDLTGIGDKPASLLDFGDRGDVPRRQPDWLAAKVSAPRSFRAGLRMPDFHFDREQIEALVTALLSCISKPPPPAYRVTAAVSHDAPPGRFGSLVREYRCLSCHQIGGIGGDISTASLTWEGSKVTKEWLKRYLILPTAIRPILTDRMLPLEMSEEQASFIASFMEDAYLDDGIADEIFPEGPGREAAERGRRLFLERYGCQACHQIGGKGGYYGPPLDDSPEKLKSGWIAWWLQGPQRWRGDVRCPNYGLDEADARALAAYLMSLSPPASEKSGGTP